MLKCRVGFDGGLFAEREKYLQGLVVVAETRQCISLQRPVRRVAGLDGEKLGCLFERLQVLVAIGKHLRIVLPGGVIVRRELQHALQEKLGVIEYPPSFISNPCEQPHSLDMRGMLQQELADHVLGGVSRATR